MRHDSVELGRLPLGNLIHERRGKPSMSTVPILFVCQGHGRTILQEMPNFAIGLSHHRDDGSSDPAEVSNWPTEDNATPSRELLQRLRTILVFNTGVGRWLQKSLKSCGPLLEPASQIP